MALVEMQNYSFAYPAVRNARANDGKSADDAKGAQGAPETYGAPIARRADGATGAIDEDGVRGAADAPAREFVLRDVSLSVEEGAFCVITGSTGCGKSTLLRSLKSELVPVGERAGRVSVAGKSLFGPQGCEISPSESAQGIGYVMQDPDAQIVCDTVWHELAFGLENIGMHPDEMRRRVAEVAHFFGMEPWVRANTATLSGGQKQLVNVAAALALRPKLLLLDEPTSQLDPHAAKQFLFMLARVNRELGVTVVMATHAPHEAEAYETCRFALDEGEPCASRFVAQSAVDARRTARAEALRRVDACLELRDVHARYTRESPWVLRGLDMRVARGSAHALVGGNGCGKSTLIAVAAGIMRPQRGAVANECAREQAYLPQDPKTLFSHDTVAEELAAWRERCSYDERDIRSMMARFGLEPCAGRHPYDLSGGQQQKLALAKLLLARPKLLFMDEPTKGLDACACAEVALIVRALVDEGCTVLFATHDLDFAWAVADEVTMLFDGEAACTDSAEAFFASNLIYKASDAAPLYGAIARMEEGGSRA